MKVFNFLKAQISAPDIESRTGLFEDWVTAVLVGFLSLVTLITLV